jgi:hypothetical protein
MASRSSTGRRTRPQVGQPRSSGPTRSGSSVCHRRDRHHRPVGVPKARPPACRSPRCRRYGRPDMPQVERSWPSCASKVRQSPIWSRREDARGASGCGRRPSGSCAPGFGVRVLDRERDQRNRQPRRKAVRTTSGVWGVGGLDDRRVRPPLRWRSASRAHVFRVSLARSSGFGPRTHMPLGGWGEERSPPYGRARAATGRTTGGQRRCRAGRRGARTVRYGACLEPARR